MTLKRQLILAQHARQGLWNDCATLPALVTRARQHTAIGCVLADAEFDSERNYTFCRQQLKADSVIPAKRRSTCRAFRGTPADVRTFPRPKVCPELPDRECLFGRETQTLWPRSWQISV
jgi:hypothetical protein